MLRKTKVDGDSLGVSDMEVAIGLGRESGLDVLDRFLFVDALQPAFGEDARRFAFCGRFRLLFGTESMLSLLGFRCSFLCGFLCSFLFFLVGFFLFFLIFRFIF